MIGPPKEKGDGEQKKNGNSISCDGCELQFIWGLPKPPDVASLTARIGQHPHDPSLYRDRGIAWWIQGQADIAIEDFTASLDLEYRQADVYTLRGVARLCSKTKDTKVYDRAASDFDQALRYDPNLPWTYYWRATAMAKKWDKAVLDCLKCTLNLAKPHQTAKGEALKTAKANAADAQQKATAKQKPVDDAKAKADQANTVLTQATVNF